MLCILAKKFGNFNLLKNPKEAVLEISCNSVNRGAGRYQWVSKFKEMFRELRPTNTNVPTCSWSQKYKV